MPDDKQVVLISAGHAHLSIAKYANKFVLRSIQVVLIDPDTFWHFPD